MFVKVGVLLGLFWVLEYIQLSRLALSLTYLFGILISCTLLMETGDTESHSGWFYALILSSIIVTWLMLLKTFSIVCQDSYSLVSHFVM